MDPMTIAAAARVLAPIAGGLILAVERAIPGEQKGLQKFGTVLQGLRGAQSELLNGKQIAEPMSDEQLSVLVESQVQSLKAAGSLSRGVYLVVGSVQKVGE